MAKTSAKRASRTPKQESAAPSARKPSAIRHVLLMVTTERAYGRAILSGIADYVEHHTRWQHHLEVDVGHVHIDDVRFDGMIVEVADTATHEALHKAKVPAITVAHIPDRDDLPAVVVDNYAVGRMGASYLADLGLRQLGFVPTQNAKWSSDRQRGFQDECEARNVVCHVYDGGNAHDENLLAVWLDTLPNPVGVMGVNDQTAMFVSRACKIVGRRIPEHVALLGVDNEAETCRLADPPMSSIDHGSRRIGYEAAKLLDHWMTTGQKPESVVVIQPIGVTVRPSTDLLAVEDPDVVAALRFIRASADEPMKVSDVLKHVAMSRRTLEMRFRSAIGRTIHEEITRVRIDRAKHLLITSDWSIIHIADACGFPFPSQFSYAFRRETGLPPARFRQQYRYSSEIAGKTVESGNRR